MRTDKKNKGQNYFVTFSPEGQKFMFRQNKAGESIIPMGQLWRNHFYGRKEVVLWR